MLKSALIEYNSLTVGRNSWKDEVSLKVILTGLKMNQTASALDLLDIASHLEEIND